MKKLALFCALMALAAAPANAQSISSHIDSMAWALAPYGTIKAPSCHSVEIALIGPWGDYALISGVDRNRPTEPTFAVIHINALRIQVDLADLDEDRISTPGFYSMSYIAKHQGGQPWVPDNPGGLFSTVDKVKKITIETVDLKKLDEIPNRAEVSESEMGTSRDQKQLATILFVDKEHADSFQKALQKAIVICKAQ